MQKSGFAAGRTADVIQTRPLLVEHRVVDVVLAGPDRFLIPVRRRLPASSPSVGGVFGSRTVSFTWLIVLLDRIEDRQVVGAELERSVDQTVGVERGIAPVGRHLDRGDALSDPPSPTA